MENVSRLVLLPNEGVKITAGSSTIIFKLLSEATFDRFSISEYYLPPFFPGPPPHKHKVFEHAWYVLEGELSVNLNHEEFKLTTGSFVFIPKKTVHAFANQSGGHVRLLAIDTPGGFENYYMDLQKATHQGKELDQETIRYIQLNYDTYHPHHSFEGDVMTNT